KGLTVCVSSCFRSSMNRGGHFFGGCLRAVCLGFLGIILSRNNFEFPAGPQIICQTLLGSRDGVLIFVKQFFNSECNFHVAFAINSLPGAILLRSEHRK